MANLPTDLRQLLRYVRRFLERDGEHVLHEVIAQVEGNEDDDWEILIPSEKSLMFKPSSADPRLSPDIFCRIRGSGDELNVSQLNVVLRVWSLDKDMSYREEWDSPKLRDTLEAQGWRRVIWRVHFDMATPGDPAPQYHVQVGGVQQDAGSELCWFPHVVRLPRILHPPLSLFLACELVLANFFPDEFAKLLQRPEWKAIINRSEEKFLLPYYRRCLSAHVGPERTTILEALWNPA